MEQLGWLACGITTIVAALMAAEHPRARLLGRGALGVLFLVLGAGVNAWYLATDVDYADFAEGSYVGLVRDTWASVVAPHQAFWIGLLIAFEAVVGVLVLLGGRATRVALVAMIAFHVALVLFGWWFWFWALPMIGALWLLLRAEQTAAQYDVPSGRRSERSRPAA